MCVHAKIVSQASDTNSSLHENFLNSTFFFNKLQIIGELQHVLTIPIFFCLPSSPVILGITLPLAYLWLTFEPYDLWYTDVPWKFRGSICRANRDVFTNSMMSQKTDDVP